MSVEEFDAYNSVEDFFFFFCECSVLIVAIMKGTSSSDLNPRSNLIEGE